MNFQAFAAGFATGRFVLSGKSIASDHFYGITFTSQQNKHTCGLFKKELEQIFPNKLLFAILIVGSTLYASKILPLIVYGAFLDHTLPLIVELSYALPIFLYTMKEQLLHPSNF